MIVPNLDFEGVSLDGVAAQQSTNWSYTAKAAVDGTIKTFSITGEICLSHTCLPLGMCLPLYVCLFVCWGVCLFVCMFYVGVLVGVLFVCIMYQ